MSGFTITDLVRDLLRTMADKGVVLAVRDIATGELVEFSTVVEFDAITDLSPEDEVSLSRATRRGAFGRLSYGAVRTRLVRSRREFPEFTPVPRMYGAETLYRFGDLVQWHKEYTKVTRDIWTRNISEARRRGAATKAQARAQSEELFSPEPAVAETVEALDALMDSLRKKEEDA